MRIPKKILVVGVVIAGMASGGAALAYWSATGGGEGSATVGSAAGVEVKQVGTIAGLAPGSGPQVIGFSVKNPSSSTSVFVHEVTVSIAGVDKGAAAGTCDSSDFLIKNATTTVDQEMAAGDTLPYPTPGATIEFVNKPTNQDACKGAYVYLAFAAS